MRQYFIFLLFLAACQSVEVVEVIPEPIKPIKVFEHPEQEPIYTPKDIEQPNQTIENLEQEPNVQEFILVESQNIIISGKIPVKFLGLIDDKAQIRINQTIFLLSKNESIEFAGFNWSVLEINEIFRKSYADAFLNGARTNIYVDERYNFGNATITVDFIGLQNNEPSARFVVNEQSEILQEDGEHYFDEGFVYVQNIYFFDAIEVDAVTMSVH